MVGWVGYHIEHTGMLKLSTQSLCDGQERKISLTLFKVFIFNCFSSRPGQRGTTGQLIFSKCEDPPEKCNCVLDPPKPSKKFSI